MNCWTRKFGRLFCTSLYFLFCGVEYVVVLPTLNGYLKSLNAPPGFLGMVMASFSFTGLITTPIYGLLTDKTRTSKFALVVSNLFEITGNIMYFMGQSYYIILASRLVAGIGSGSGSSILAMMARTTSTEERTSVFSILMSLRQVGLVIGPAANIFFHDTHATIGPFPVNELTSPGLFMACVWLFHTVLVIFVYYDDVENAELVSVSHEPNYMLTNNHSNARTFRLSMTMLYDEFIREEIVLCLSITFVVMFVQLGLETVLTPLTYTFFGWGGLFNSYLYAGAGCVIVLSFCALTILSRRCEDRNLILLGIITTVIGELVLIAYSGRLLWSRKFTQETPSWLLYVFLLDVVIYCIGMPFCWVPMASVFSKLTSVESQGFSQGIRLTVLGIGQILGPIWAAPMATYERLPYMGVVYTFLMMLLLCMTLASYRKLRISSGEADGNGDANHHNHDEANPLLCENSDGGYGIHENQQLVV